MSRSKLIAVCFLLAIAVAIGGTAWFTTTLETPVTHANAAKVINIPQGSSPDDTVAILAGNGIISGAAPLKLYIRLTKAGPDIKAGDYLFPSPISAKQVLEQLEKGGLPPNKLTIIEGWTKWDIAAEMTAKPDLKLKSEDQALALMKNVSLVQEFDPVAQDLEGYMFPDTYFIETTTTPKDLIEASVARFKHVWDENLSSAALESKKSVHDTVTVASIIETEAKLEDERPIVASVIYNRLKAHMTLSVDSTIIYASKLAGKWRNNGIVYKSDVERRSPYNTRIFMGLPPGPVGNPGLPSLKAALHPAKTGFLYYVRNPDRNDGAHNFYRDAAEFEKGVQALRSWEKKRGPVPVPAPVASTNTTSAHNVTPTTTTTRTRTATTTTTTTTKKSSAAKPAPAAHKTTAGKSNAKSSKVNKAKSKAHKR